jgi:predicted RNase H-like nuclease (RuvC/YqgF family)
MYVVIKSHAHINGKVYAKGDSVELSDKDALHLLAENVVIGDVATQLPSEADGLLEELKKENAALKETIEQQKGIIKRLTTEIETARNETTLLKTRKR